MRKNKEKREKKRERVVWRERAEVKRETLSSKFLFNSRKNRDSKRKRERQS